MKRMTRSSIRGAASAALTLSLAVWCSTAIAGQADKHRVAGELVSRSETAIAIATAVATETYGSATVTSQLPLVAVTEGKTWHVSGSLPAGTPGGILEVWIAPRDGRVLRLTHGR